MPRLSYDGPSRDSRRLARHVQFASIVRGGRSVRRREAESPRPRLCFQGRRSADRDRDAEPESEQGADTRGAVRAPDGGEDGGAWLACLVDSLGARRHGYAGHVLHDLLVGHFHPPGRTGSEIEGELLTDRKVQGCAAVSYTHLRA